MMRPYQKNKTWRSKKYLDYIRKQPCVVCGHTSTQAHHVKTVGSGGGDEWAIPLCVPCHQTIHLVGRDTFFRRLKVNIQQELFNMVAGYLINS